MILPDGRKHPDHELDGIEPPIVVIPLKRLDGVTRKSLRMAMALTPDIRAVQVLTEAMKSENLSETWRIWWRNQR